MNPRRTQEPETVFETAAFDRSATPPRDAQGTRRQDTVMFSFMPAAFRELTVPGHEGMFRVVKVSSSPLPNDSRVCAYVEQSR